MTEKLEGEDRNGTGADWKKQRKDSFYFSVNTPPLLPKGISLRLDEPLA
jgi:hypothetical protein